MNRRSLWLEKVKLVNWTNGWCASILSFSEEALSQLNLRKLSRVPLSDQDEVWTERWRMLARWAYTRRDKSLGGYTILPALFFYIIGAQKI